MEGLSLRDTDRFRPLRLGPTARNTLQEFVDIDVTASDLAGILRRNQAYRNLFARFVHAKIKPKAAEGEAPPKDSGPVHRMIGLLGMIGSRNLIVSLRMHKAVTGQFPVDEAGEVNVKASDYVKRATEAEDTFARLKLEHGESAYAAGCLYDWLARLTAARGADKSVEALVNEQWKKALRAGLVAHHLAEELPGFSPKQTVPAAMLPAAGKILLAEAHPTYAAWDAAQAERALPPAAALLAERQRFGLSHEEVAAHALHYFDLFWALSPVVRHYREPYALKGLDAANYSLAALTLVAHTLGSAWKIPADNDPALAKLLAHPSVKHFKLKPSAIVRVMKSAMTSAR